MKCPVCVEQGLKSKLYGGGGSRTLMSWQPYHDEDGTYHNHDPNRGTYHYECSNGHALQMNVLDKCPGCDYGMRELKAVPQTQKNSPAAS